MRHPEKISYPESAAAILATIARLSSNDSNRERLGNAGACEISIHLLEKFGATHPSVSEEGLASLWNLSYNNSENRNRLGRGGACEIACELLRTHGVTNSDGKNTL